MVAVTRLARVAASAAIGGFLALSALPALPARAATSIDWAAPTATSEFGVGITFEQPVTAVGLDARRIEVLLTQTGVDVQFVRTLPLVGPIADTTLQYTLLEANAHLYPNGVQGDVADHRYHRPGFHWTRNDGHVRRHVVHLEDPRRERDPGALVPGR